MNEPSWPEWSSLRIAWTDDVGGAPVSADTKTALQSFVGKLAERGCHVERATPPDFDYGLAKQVHTLILLTAVGVTLPRMARFMGRLFGGVRAFDLDLKRYLRAEVQRTELVTAMDRFLSGWDAWICPVTSTPAFVHHNPTRYFGPTPIYTKPLPLDDGTVDYYVANQAFTIPFNVTGHPVVTLPVGQSKEGLPIGVQIVGKRWRDMDLLAVAAQLAGVTGPLPHPPGY